MRKLFNSKSVSSCAFFYLCLLAFFIDSANVTDIFGRNTVIHVGEGDEDALIVSPLQFGIKASCELTAIPHRAHVQKILYDQDSPTLSSVFPHASELLSVLNTQQPIVYSTALSSELLYIRNCTFLL